MVKALDESDSAPPQDGSPHSEAAQPVQISILITNWNTRDFLAQCLRSLETVLLPSRPGTAGELSARPDNSTHPNSWSPWEIFVVDNASSDGSAEMVRQNFPWVELVESPKNLGFGGGCNRAAQLARGKYLLVLNPDVILFPPTLPGLLAFMHHTPQAGAVGPRILNPDGTLQVSIFPRPTLFREAWRLFHLDQLHPLSQYPQSLYDARQPLEVDVLMGACILLRNEIVHQIGLFDERFFMYSEEVDLCQRIQQAGWGIFWLPTVEIIHFGGQSTRLVADQMFIELYRNKLNYFRKHYGLESPLKGAVAVGIYKTILFVAALTRWLSGSFLSNSPFASHSIEKREHWKTIARQYRRLLNELSEL